MVKETLKSDGWNEAMKNPRGKMSQRFQGKRLQQRQRFQYFGKAKRQNM